MAIDGSKLDVEVGGEPEIGSEMFQQLHGNRTPQRVGLYLEREVVM